ncbi:MAG: RNA methyltransferase [Muribaculaceae bacterium]|nr:RNA methyltransferase [Muribaculaceae bacterium]
MTTAPAFEMVAKTFQGLEDVLAEELRGIGATNVEPGRRMVSFEGTLETLYRANLCCRTALRILKPFYKFEASTPDELYEHIKAYDWSTLLDQEKTFSIDTVAFGDEFTHTRFATYRVKDGIVDWFRDHYGPDSRPRVRLENADIILNVHIHGRDVSVSLDSSGESLHKRGYRLGGQTEAPINEVLAAGIILKSGYRGDTPFVDPMCGSGTFLVEAALIAANIFPGVFRQHYAFETWPDFDKELFETLYNDDSAERTPSHPIVGADISPKAVEISRENLKGAGVSRYVTVEVKPLSKWEESDAPRPSGILVTNPPYGQRISAPDMEALYRTIGTKLKHVFTGYHAWIIGYKDEYFHEIGLAPSQKEAVNNGGLDCELREYVIFEGSKRDFRAAGGRIKDEKPDGPAKKSGGFERKKFDKDRKPFGRDRKPGERDRRPFDKERKPFDRERKPSGKDRKPFEKGGKPFDRERKTFDKEREPRHFGRRDTGDIGARGRLRLESFGRGPSISPDKEERASFRPAMGWRKRGGDAAQENKTED